MIRTSLWHMHCAHEMGHKNVFTFFQEHKRCTRDGETGFPRRYSVVGFLLQKRSRRVRQITQFRACQWRSTLFATVFRKIFLANIPSNMKQSIFWGSELTSMAASSAIPKASSGAMTAVSFAHCFLGVPNTSSRSKLVSDSQFENSGCDMQLFINTCLYASANCLGSGLAENPPFALIKLKQFSRGSWFDFLVHKYFTPQTDFTSSKKRSLR